MSKMFEMLQQAQRDRDLLKQSSPAPAIHSRNLDVLHRAGKDQHLFEIPSVPETSQTEQAPPSAGPSRGETFKLVQQLFLVPNPLSPRAVVFCAADKDGGRDLICGQTAEFLSSLKQASICAVDANVTNPTLHSYFGVSNGSGLSAALVESGPVMDFTRQIGRGRLRAYERGRTILGTEFRSGFGFPASCRTNTRTPGEFRLCFGERSACNPRLDYRLSELIVRWRRSNR